MKIKISKSKILEWLTFRIWIGKIASDAEYRLDEPFQNLIIFWILIIFQTEKISNLENSKNL